MRVAALVLLGVCFVAVTAPADAPSRPATASGAAPRRQSALIARYAPGVGQLELAVSGGIAVTQLTNYLAQATAHTADFGLIGTALAAETCRGNRYFQESDYPQPTSVDNREGDAHLSRDESRSDGAPVGAGRMEVSATKAVPAASATTTGVASGVTAAVEIGQGTADAVTRVIPNEGREAIATVSSSVDVGGGLLQLRGLRWFAHHRTGAEPLAEASFEIGGATFGGVPFPTDDLQVLEDGLNQALAPSGVVLTFRRVERLTTPTDLIRATPLRIEFRDSPLADTAFGPVLDLTRDEREQLFDDLTSFVCDLASVLLVGDITLSVATGTGFLVIDVGGVEATSGDFVVTDPFGGPLEPVGAPGAEAGAPAQPAATVAVPAGTVAPPASATERPATPIVSDGPIVELCESIHPSRSPACSAGTVAVIVLVAAIATLAIGGGDYVRQRRRAVSRADAP